MDNKNKPVGKKFDYALFKANDKLARDIGKKYWSSLNYKVYDNPDRYGPDLIVEEICIDTYRHNIANDFYCEMEIKRAWKGKEFRYKTCQIPQRKGKYLDKTKYDKTCNFFIINNEYEYAFFIKEEDISSSPLVEVPNKYVPAGEFFYQVSLDKCKLIELGKHSNEK